MGKVYDGWVSFTPESGNAGENRVFVHAHENIYPWEREKQFKVFTNTESVNITIRQDAAIVTGGSYVTVYYDVSSLDTKYIYHPYGGGEIFRAMKVNDGEFEKSVSRYQFKQTGINKIDFLLMDSKNGIPDYYFQKEYGSSNETFPITQVLLPNTITELGEFAFDNQRTLSSITIPLNLTTIGSAAFMHTGLLDITIPDSVTNIDSSLFYNCYNLSAVTIGSGLTTISLQMFRNCTSLGEISIPSNVITIDNYAFSGDTSLQTIYAYPSIAPTISGNKVFTNIPNNGILHYPYGSDYSTWLTELNSYASGWTGVADL